MIAYIVVERIDYYGDEIWGVFDSEEAADAFISTRAARHRYEVKEWEILGSVLKEKQDEIDFLNLQIACSKQEM